MSGWEASHLQLLVGVQGSKGKQGASGAPAVFGNSLHPGRAKGGACGRMKGQALALAVRQGALASDQCGRGTRF